MWRQLEPIVPSMGHNPAPYVIVGMMCCFGGISLVPPGRDADGGRDDREPLDPGTGHDRCGLAWFIVRRSDDTIYRSQLKDLAEAPAQRLLTGMPVLANVSVLQAMAPSRLMITGGPPPAAARHEIEHAGVSSAPVIDGEGRFEGTLSLGDLPADRPGKRPQTPHLSSTLQLPPCQITSNLDVAVEVHVFRFRALGPGVDSERKVIGTIATSDVVGGYRLALLPSLQKINAEGASQRHRQGGDRTGVQPARTDPRQANCLISVMVTTIVRNHDLVVPDGNTVLEVGDELVVIGQSSDIDLILKTTTDRSAHGGGHGCIREGQGEGSPGSVIPGTKER